VTSGAQGNADACRGLEASPRLFAVAGMGWFAILSDPQGNPFALWQGDETAK
jgi:hypothetical protein